MPQTTTELPVSSPAPFSGAFGTLHPQPAIQLGSGLEVVLVRTAGVCDPAPGDRLAFLPEVPDAVVIEEDGQGTVPVLKARNHSDLDVFVLAGQLIRGGKQNRGINADALVPAKGVIDLPVTCVERGRWSGGTVRDRFHAAGIEPSFIRSEKMRGVHAMKRHAFREQRETSSAEYFRADQGQVWNAIADFQLRVGRGNPSSDLLGSMGGMPGRETGPESKMLREAWQGASGMLVFLEGEFIGGDILGCSRWFEAVREQLLESALVSREFVRSRRGSDWMDEQLAGEMIAEPNIPGVDPALWRRHMARLLLQAQQARGQGATRRAVVPVDHMARSILTDAMAGTWAVQRGVGAERAWQLEHPFMEAAACVSPSGRPLHLLIGTARTPQVFMN